mmetsp:Transcript_17888/g.26511  ORF Transcript_17888/g.26511 Transcript_17888/m.26511 type:complete len:209 (-) Transcript_17888:837-1463(-)
MPSVSGSLPRPSDAEIAEEGEASTSFSRTCLARSSLIYDAAAATANACLPVPSCRSRSCSGWRSRATSRIMLGRYLSKAIEACSMRYDPKWTRYAPSSKTCALHQRRPDLFWRVVRSDKAWVQARKRGVRCSSGRRSRARIRCALSGSVGRHGFVTREGSASTKTLTTSQLADLSMAWKSGVRPYLSGILTCWGCASKRAFATAADPP